MRTKYYRSKSVLMLIGIIFFIIGAAFVGVGTAVLLSHDAFMKNAVKTEAVISGIESHSYRKNGKTRTEHDVRVVYEADGNVYEELLGYYSSGMSEGDMIEIYYDPDDPSEIMSDSKLLELMFILLGSIFAVLGAIFILIKISSANRRKRLIETGDRLTGIITDVVINNAVRINGRHPFKAECEVIDPFSGEKYLFASESVTSDISYLEGREVTVYTDRNDKRKYFVDIYELMDNYISEEKIHDYR
ncbi:MAG: DUF3592 domain-containing protein [Oscillospiraceae bacterium]|nr:DUF3592 domain-containing protein [Oscillospiraceae bacterium]MDY2848457.1 DUF3592 domain-containing protein [Oscillospiraceae bacterium]